VSDPEVRVIIDVSPMKRVYYDAERGAVAVAAGATVGETFRALFDTWGVVLPLGEYPEIGMGGHVVGGAFGFLCRQLGLRCQFGWDDFRRNAIMCFDLYGPQFPSEVSCWPSGDRGRSGMEIP